MKPWDYHYVQAEALVSRARDLADGDFKRDNERAVALASIAQAHALIAIADKGVEE